MTSMDFNSREVLQARGIAREAHGRRGKAAILHGPAVGWPARLPDYVTLKPLIQLQQAFDLCACLRPAGLSGCDRTAANEAPSDLVRLP